MFAKQVRVNLVKKVGKLENKRRFILLARTLVGKESNKANPEIYIRINNNIRSA